MNKLDEQLAKIEEQERQLKERKKKLLNQQKEKERKERTRRLIEIGAVAESVLGKPINKNDLIKFQMFLEQQEKNGEFFSKALK